MLSILFSLFFSGPVLSHLVSEAVTVDANGDKYDDVVLFNGPQAWLYLGQPTYPYFRADKRIFLSMAGKILYVHDTPIYSGGLLYIPVIDGSNPKFEKSYIYVGSPKTGKILGSVELKPYTIHENFQIEQFRICKSPKGIVAVTFERNILSGGSIQFFELSGLGIYRKVLIPRPKALMKGCQVSDIFPLKGYGVTNRYLVVYSYFPSLTAVEYKGFGFQSVEDGKVTGETWYPGPPIHWGGRGGSQASVFPLHSTPVMPFTQVLFQTYKYPKYLVKSNPFNGSTVWGRARTAPPHVEIVYEPILLSAGHFINGTNRDYDGDGAEEVVYASWGYLFVGDLDISRKYSQLFTMNRGAKDKELLPVAGAAGDFDGDGKLDLFIFTEYYPGNETPVQCIPSFLKGKGIKGKPSLEKVY